MGKRSKRCKNRVWNISETMLLPDKPGLDLNRHTFEEEREPLEVQTEAVKRMIFEKDSINEVCDKSFYVICFNITCRTDEEEYIPNEVGVAKYSIRNGIEEHYHCFIDPGAIPMGYAYASKKHSDDTHDIPISNFELANNNYNKILRKILDVVNPTGKTVVPVFCREENLAQNWSCLQWLAFEANLDVESIHLYDVTCLLMELRAYIGHPLPSRTAAIDFLNSHIFDYTPHTRCNYHEDRDNTFCALAYAKRTCFILSDTLCTFYGINHNLNYLPSNVRGTILQKMPQSLSLSPRTSSSPKLHKHAVSRNTSMTINTRVSKIDDEKAQSSDTYNAQPRISKFHKPQLGIASCNRDDASHLNFEKPGKLCKMRQPYTTPLVLNGTFPSKSESVNGNNHL